jgi:hypothetical protein
MEYSAETMESWMEQDAERRALDRTEGLGSAQRLGRARLRVVQGGAAEKKARASSGRYRSAAPERRLVLAVLEDAISIFLRPTGRRSARDARLEVEVEAWLAADDPSWPLSFVNVCAVLELSPECLRRALAAARARVRGR